MNVLSSAALDRDVPRRSKKRPVVLGLSGSLRCNSYNTIILESLRERIAPGVDLRILNLRDIAVYNEDDDGEVAAPPIMALRSAVIEADGVIIATPEYNHGVPGMLKNVLDWVSRPKGRAALTGKPVLTVTSSTSVTGGVRAHAQLNETLLSIAARLIVRPQAVIGTVHLKIRDNRLQDEAVMSFLSAGVNDLLLVANTPAAVQIEQD
jgi:chromate reductase